MTARYRKNSYLCRKFYKKLTMNKLLDAVKDKCKDMGLSEKFLKDITEALGGGLKEDSTDEEFNSVVEQIVKIAGQAQGEVTRKFQQKKNPNKTKTTKTDEGDEDADKDPDGGDKDGDGKSELDKAIAKIRKEFQDELKRDREERNAEKERDKRAAAITAAMDKYKIPEKHRRFIQNVPDDVEDVDKYISEYAQGVVTDSLPGGGSGERKVPTQKETEETGKGWFERLTGKKQKETNN